MAEKLTGKFIDEETRPLFQEVLDECGQHALDTVQAILECYAQAQGNEEKVTGLLAKKVMQGELIHGLVFKGDMGPHRTPRLQYLDKAGKRVPFVFPGTDGDLLDSIRANWGPVERTIIEVALIFHKRMRPDLEIDLVQMARELRGVQFRLDDELAVLEELADLEEQQGVSARTGLAKFFG